MNHKPRETYLDVRHVVLLLVLTEWNVTLLIQGHAFFKVSQGGDRILVFVIWS